MSVRREFGGRSAVRPSGLPSPRERLGRKEGGILLELFRAPRAGFPRGPWGKGPEPAIGPDRRFRFGRVVLIKSTSCANPADHSIDVRNLLRGIDLRDEPFLRAAPHGQHALQKPVSPCKSYHPNPSGNRTALSGRVPESRMREGYKERRGTGRWRSRKRSRCSSSRRGRENR